MLWALIYKKNVKEYGQQVSNIIASNNIFFFIYFGVQQIVETYK